MRRAVYALALSGQVLTSCIQARGMATLTRPPGEITAVFDRVRYFMKKPFLRRYLPYSLLLLGSTLHTAEAFTHPGLLDTRLDLQRMKKEVAAGTHPYLDGWNKLRQDPHASPAYNPLPWDTVTRTLGAVGTGFQDLNSDALAAYYNAIAWNITGDSARARKSVEILNAWSGRLQAIEGDGDKYLVAGIYGSQLLFAAEIIRHTYAGWKPADINRFTDLMLRVFYPLNHDFLIHHNGSRVDHYFANWDACQMLAIAALGVFLDDSAKYLEATEYFKSGRGNGCILKAVWDGETGQLQESGRDQAHAQLGIGLLAELCEIAWSQGDDLYGFAGNRLLKGFEYTAGYLLGNDVPFKIYSDSSRTFTVISAVNREQRRPIYEMVWNHYENRRGTPAPYTRQLAEAIRPEGYHADHPGFGTLFFTLPRLPIAMQKPRPMGARPGEETFVDALGKISPGKLSRKEYPCPKTSG